MYFKVPGDVFRMKGKRQWLKTEQRKKVEINEVSRSDTQSPLGEPSSTERKVRRERRQVEVKLCWQGAEKLSS